MRVAAKIKPPGAWVAGVHPLRLVNLRRSQAIWIHAGGTEMGHLADHAKRRFLELAEVCLGKHAHLLLCIACVHAHLHASSHRLLEDSVLRYTVSAHKVPCMTSTPLWLTSTKHSIHFNDEHFMHCNVKGWRGPGQRVSFTRHVSLSFKPVLQVEPLLTGLIKASERCQSEVDTLKAHEVMTLW
jgi:hypothetical protein